MRGGKITAHAGAKHGLGGKSFRKGTMVGRQVMMDRLDPTQPLTELTFNGVSVAQINTDMRQAEGEADGPDSPIAVPVYK